MEVRMPTGSLCAERNVIGTALATNPDMRREDLKIVAVLAIELREEKASQSTCQTPSPPPGVSTKICTSIGSKPKIFGKSDLLCSVEKKLAKFQKPENMRQSMSRQSMNVVSGWRYTCGDSEHGLCDTRNQVQWRRE